ncbi:MAG TPA: ATP-binding cassette domain-containing protein [Streptosporangiaceae bacterium]|nr:ATP-binding cassette domain-containing protein [Streptosporangiaceae bacterium]
MTAAAAPAQARASTGIRLADVTAEYVPRQPTLSGLSLWAAPGRITVILGPNGSGKSTSLKVMAGLLQPWRGKVEIVRGAETHDLTGAPCHDRARHKIAYLPQGHSVFPAMSVHDNLVLGAWPLKRDRRAAAAAIAAAYERYPMLRDKRRVPAGSLSGGQQRILEVARLLVADPDLVLVDEPSTGVAPAVASMMYVELARMRSEGRTVVLVDQDVRSALDIGDAVYTLRSGRNDRHGEVSEFAGDVTALAREWLSAGPTASEEKGG